MEAVQAGPATRQEFTYSKSRKALIITLELLPSLVWISLGICSGFAFHQFGYRQELLQVTGMIGIGVSAIGLAYQLRRDILPLARYGISSICQPSEPNSAQK